jgi:hypothetical protein
LDAEGSTRAEEFFLAYEFIEGAGTHALGEGLEGRGGFGLRKGGEEAHRNRVYLVLREKSNFGGEEGDLTQRALRKRALRERRSRRAENAEKSW